MAAPVLRFKRGAFVNLPGLRAGEPGFTTDKYDLYVGLTSETNTNKFFGSHRYWGREDGTTSLRFKLVDKDGNNSISLKSPDTLDGDISYQLPGIQGAANSVLTNDGNGILTWGSGSDNAVFSGITTVNGISLDVNVDADFSGITTFSNTENNTLGDSNTGAVQINGGLGVDKNVTVGGDLNVQGYSDFVGVVTFRGGTINLGDSTTDVIDLNGRIGSDLVPNQDNAYDVGISTLNWRNANFSGIGTFESGLVANSVQIGVTGSDIIDTTSGDLVLNSAGGKVTIQPHVDIYGDLNVTGNVSVGGTTVTLRGTDVFIENKDIILGYTTSTTPDDDTANHGGIAIASTEGNPLVSFTASGINTLPDTYKQMMWFQSGTLGFSTDMFAFNYGVAIGTTTVANGIRLAVGSDVRITDTEVNAPVGNFGTLSGSLTGTISTATRANSVDTTSTSANTNYHLVFTDNASSTDGATMRVDAGIYYNPSTNNLFASQFIGDISAGTIKAADATTSMTLANSTGDVTFNGDIQLGGSDIKASDGNTNITLTSNTLTTFAGDIKITGNDIQASDGTTALTLSTTTGNVKTGGDLIAGSGYLTSEDGTRAMYMYNTSGDVSFQGKVIANNFRSSTNANDTLTFSDIDATFARNLNIVGVTTTAQLTIGTGVAVTQFSASVSTGSSTSSVPTSSAVIDYVESFVGTEIGSLDLTLSIDADNGGPSSVTTSQTLTIAGTPNEIETSVSGQTITVGLPNDVIVGTSLSAPTIKTATIQHSNGTQAATIDASGNVVAAQNFTIQGNLYVNGSTTQVNTQTLTVEDRLIEAGKVQSPPPDSTWDVGILFNYYKSNANKRAGVFWDDSAGRIAFAAETSVLNDNDTLPVDPLVTVTTWAPIEVASLWVNDCAGQSQVISCTGSERFLQNITIDAGTF